MKGWITITSKTMIVQCVDKERAKHLILTMTWDQFNNIDKVETSAYVDEVTGKMVPPQDMTLEAVEWRKGNKLVNEAEEIGINKWKSGWAGCTNCDYRSMAVAPTGTEPLECSNCGKMTMYFEERENE